MLKSTARSFIGYQFRGGKVPNVYLALTHGGAEPDFLGPLLLLLEETRGPQQPTTSGKGKKN